MDFICRKTILWRSHAPGGRGCRPVAKVQRRGSAEALPVHYFIRLLIAVLIGALPQVAFGQDRLKQMPGYEQYAKMVREIPTSVKMGSLSVTWKDGGQSFEYQRDGKRYRYDIATQKLTELAPPASGPSTMPTTGPAGRAGFGRGRGLAGGVMRGRQSESSLSPDRRLKAFYRDRNLWISDASGANEVAITTQGNEKDRIKFGTASWVYGEELQQRTAMWWSPDSSKIAYYRFDESRVPDFYLQMAQTRPASTVDVEAYPKPGDPNPIVDL